MSAPDKFAEVQGMEPPPYSVASQAPSYAPNPAPYPQQSQQHTQQGQPQYPVSGQAPYPQTVQPSYPQNVQQPYPQTASKDGKYGQAYGVPPGTYATTTIVASQPYFGMIPVNMLCTNCHSQIVTRIEYKTGILTWLLCGALAFFGCIWGCCLIPFCIDSCKDALHSCPNCHVRLGQCQRI